MVIVISKKYPSIWLVSKNISTSRYDLLRLKFIGSGSNVKLNNSRYRCPEAMGSAVTGLTEIKPCPIRTKQRWAQLKQDPLKLGPAP
jgi:hypothetical protein